MALCAFSGCKRPAASISGYCDTCTGNLRILSLLSKEDIDDGINALKLRVARREVARKPAAGSWLAILLVKRKRRAAAQAPPKRARTRRATHHAPATELAH